MLIANPRTASDSLYPRSRALTVNKTIDHLGQSELPDEFIYEKTPSITNEVGSSSRMILTLFAVLTCLIFFIFTLQVIRMKIVYMMCETLWMADLRDVKGIL